MRTTVDLPDQLLAEVRKLTAERNTTLRALVEEGLRRILDETRGTGGAPFELRDASFQGPRGFAPGMGPDDVRRVLEETNEGRRFS